MPPLTWQQVAAPNFAGSNALLTSAGNQISGSFDGLADALGKFGTNQQQVATAALLGNASQHTDAASLQGAIADGSIFNGVNQGYLTPDSYKALDNHATNLLANATSQEALQTSNRTEDARVANADLSPAVTQAGINQTNANTGLVGEQTNYNRATEGIRAAALGSENAYRDSQTSGALQNQSVDADRFNAGKEANAMIDASNQASDKASQLAIVQQSPGSPEARNQALAVINARPDAYYAAQGGVPISGGAPLTVPPLQGGFRLPVGGTPPSNAGSLPQKYGASLASGDTTGALASIEGLKTTPYWDVNHWRTGYGSDTITNPDGSYSAVGGANGSNPNIVPNTSITPADATRDLQRRTAQSTQTASDAVGPAWDNLNPATQSSLTSMAYNYGHVPGDVVKAASSGDPHSIALAIASHAFDNNGVNYNRRMAESGAVAGQFGSGASGTPSAGAVPVSAALAAASAGAAVPPVASTSSPSPAPTGIGVPSVVQSPGIAAPPSPINPSAAPSFEDDRQASINASAEAARLSNLLKIRTGQGQSIGIGTKITDTPPDGGDLSDDLSKMLGTTKTTTKNADGTTTSTDAPGLFSGNRQDVDDIAQRVKDTAANLHVTLSPSDITNLIKKNASDYTPRGIASWFVRPGAQLTNSGQAQLEDDIKGIGDGTGVTNAVNTKAAATIASTIDNLNQQQQQAFQTYQSTAANAQRNPSLLPAAQAARARYIQVQTMLNNTLSSVNAAGQKDEKGQLIPNSNKYLPLTTSELDRQKKASVSSSIAAAANATPSGSINQSDGRD